MFLCIMVKASRPRPLRRSFRGVVVSDFFVLFLLNGNVMQEKGGRVYVFLSLGYSSVCWRA